MSVVELKLFTTVPALTTRFDIFFAPFLLVIEATMRFIITKKRVNIHEYKPNCS